MSDIVYNEGQAKNLKELQKRTIETTGIISNERRNTIKNLFQFSSSINVCLEK